MSTHKIELTWKRTSADFQYATYNRGHVVRFKNGEAVGMSAAVAYKGDAERVDPEEMLVASLSSCHMLTFLALAAKAGLVVDGYEDQAEGVLAKNAEGRLAMTEVVLRPKVKFAAGKGPSAEQLGKLHHTAHEQCFIANSVKTEVRVE